MAAAAAVGLLFSIVGAFGSAPMPLVVRTPLMVVLSLIAAALGVVSVVLAGRPAWLGAAWWRRGTAAGLLMTAPMAVLVWAAERLVLAPLLPARAILLALPTSAATSVFFCLVASYLIQVRAGPAAPTAAAPEPRFLERLPPRLRGAELFAVEAQDHYLRLHTSKGQDLILFRLADAVAELEGMEGAQAHRSWWVAREAIAEVRRGDGRAILTLKNGVQAPVSRVHARRLRALGWL